MRNALLDRHPDQQQPIDGAPAQKIQERLVRGCRAEITEQQVDILVAKPKSDALQQLIVEGHGKRRNGHRERARSLLRQRLRRSVGPELQLVDRLEYAHARGLRHIGRVVQYARDGRNRYSCTVGHVIDGDLRLALCHLLSGRLILLSRIGNILRIHGYLNVYYTKKDAARTRLCLWADPAPRGRSPLLV